MRTIIVAVTAVLVAGVQQPRAQEHVALAIEGWTQSEKAGGIVDFRCSGAICASGSEVSYKRQPHRPGVTLAEFEAHHRRLAQQYSGTGNLKTLRVSGARERNMGGVRVLQLRRDFDFIDGTSRALIESRLIGPGASYSLVSVSPRFEWTQNNYEGFLPRIVDIAALATAQTAE
jgi:hypothetical protein